MSVADQTGQKGGTDEVWRPESGNTISEQVIGDMNDILNRKFFCLLASAFFFLCIVTILNEVIDLPHLILRAPKTPVNLSESFGEILVITIVGIVTLSVFKKYINVVNSAKNGLMIANDVLKSSINGVAIADLNGRIIYANDAFLNLMGYENGGDVLGLDIRQLFRYTDETEPIIERIMQNGYYSGELKGRKKDNSDIYLQAYGSVIKNKDNSPYCLAGTFIDITRLKKAEAEKSLAMRQIADNMRQFAILNDQIRNPLQVICSIASMDEGENCCKIQESVFCIDALIREIDTGFVESLENYQFMERHYGISKEDYY
ncbi:MAG: PAS domain-containing protein [Euryarchaeota archaeon]|nr:PAS domain-containing protein [Euryarchaeota archaeon]